MMARGSRICLKWLWWLCLIWGSMSSSLAQQHQHEQQRQREFLYVPEGGSREDGTVLRQIDQSQLPPGEYEVVAMFDTSGEEKRKERYTPPSPPPPPPAPLPGSEPSPFADYRLAASASGDAAGYSPYQQYHGSPYGGGYQAPTPQSRPEYRYPHPPPPPPKTSAMPTFDNFPAKREVSNERSAGFGADEQNKWAEYVSSLTHGDRPSPVRDSPYSSRESSGGGSGYRLPGVAYASRPHFFHDQPQHLHPRQQQQQHHQGDSHRRRSNGNNNRGGVGGVVRRVPAAEEEERGRRNPPQHHSGGIRHQHRGSAPPSPPRHTAVEQEGEKDRTLAQYLQNHNRPRHYPERRRPSPEAHEPDEAGRGGYRPVRPDREEELLYHRQRLQHEEEERRSILRQREDPSPPQYHSRYNDPRFEQNNQLQQERRKKASLPLFLSGDHWDGYDPDYKASRRGFDHGQDIHRGTNEIFVTPAPQTKRKRTKFRPQPPPPPPPPPPRELSVDEEDELMQEAGKRTKAEQELKRLYEIASGGRGATRNSIISDGGGAPKKDFVCPRDGHFPDDTDCAKYYRCAHGKAMAEYCPGNLFWNAVSDQCDWPETVDCRYNAASVSADYRAKHSDARIFLTFDDGPNNGTEIVLNALRRQGVRATFFINSKYLHDPNPKIRDENTALVLRMASEGHVIGDHSYDHMFHNSRNSPRNAYQDVEEDLKYFGLMNIYPVLDVLWKAGRKEDIPRVNHTMTYNVRMPYTNNWRVGSRVHDCHGCTVPSSSGNKGIEITNILSSRGKSVFGWDAEWEINWDRNRFKYGGKEMFFKMARDPWLKPKTVILSHDIAHRPGDVRDEGAELEEFISLAKEAGYTFDTVDNYERETVAKVLPRRRKDKTSSANVLDQRRRRTWRDRG